MSIKTIATHGAEFHADEVFGVAVLLGLHPQAKVLRTRDPGLLQTADVLIDVGGEYDPSRGRFDHHQRGGAGVRQNGVPLASAGLIWEHFGRAYLAMVVGDTGVNFGPLWHEVDRRLVQGLDAVDNGAVDSRSTLRGQNEVTIPITFLSGVISAQNGVVEIQDMSDDAQLERFHRAVDLMRAHLDQTIRQALLVSMWDVRVREADRGDAILILKNPSPDVGCPWTRFVCEREHILFVVFPCPNGNEWRVKAATPSPASFDVRKPLPAAWGGKNHTELDAVTGVDGGVFCHRGLWICGAKTREGAVRLAQLAAQS